MTHQSRLIQGIGSVAILGVALAFLLSGFGGVARGAALQPMATAPTASATATALGYAILLPQPSGSANLSWDPSHDNTLTVSLSLTGLSPATPGSYQEAAYPATIALGSCQNLGNVVNNLTALNADQHGAATSKTTIAAVAGGIPAKGWNIAVYAPGAANQRTLLACAPIPNPQAKQSVETRLHGRFSKQGEGVVHGRAKLSLADSTLTVSIYMMGLTPGSKHAAHIHTGSCAQQGPVAYPLETITADGSGHAQVETTIKGIHAIPGDWYVNVHASDDLTTQAGFEPIACGDVFSRS